jgi:hypothetical protein
MADTNEGPTVAARKHWLWAAAPLVLAALVLFIVPQLPAWRTMGRAWAFLAVLALLTGELMVIGLLLRRRFSGAFIDNRNMLSLSKLQAGGWTVLVLAAFATAAAFNATVPHVDYSNVAALSVVIPGELLLAMGISATSLVATPGLLSLKAAQTPAVGAEQAAANRTGKVTTSNGKVAGRASPADASWADLVTGDEVGNAGTPDLGKIQQALITLILLGAYGYYVFEYFLTGPASIPSLPTLDKSFVWLMGISHASYLAYKAAPHTSDGPSDAPVQRIASPQPAAAKPPGGVG